ncbi:Alpha/Beta hydrolase protein [Mycena haematopus]|nr:Alpha/Beta hydrolase protein [Mycena haematopus]
MTAPLHSIAHPVLDIAAFILDSPPTPSGQALRVAAKRYRFLCNMPQRGITLLLLHGLGQHKEQWEPILEKLFALHSDRSDFPQIREAWALDWQSHGESAVLNEGALTDDPKTASVDLWGHAIANFLKSEFVSGHRMVGVGYSFGTIGLMLSTRHFDKCPYDRIILVEPSIMEKEQWTTSHVKLQSAFDVYDKVVRHRRDVWTSKEAAHKYLMDRLPWKSWDPRVLTLFSEHALKLSTDKDGNVSAVRKCPAIHEGLAFPSNIATGNVWDAAEQISKLALRVPIDVVCGEKTDVMPPVIREGFVDKTKRFGRIVSSITVIPGVGHMVIQQLPDVVASTISSLLTGTPIRSLL